MCKNVLHVYTSCIHIKFWSVSWPCHQPIFGPGQITLIPEHNFVTTLCVKSQRRTRSSLQRIALYPMYGFAIESIGITCIFLCPSRPSSLRAGIMC